eukprot:scaffold515504_cov94-Attheya_sp.AAC.2
MINNTAVSGTETIELKTRFGEDTREVRLSTFNTFITTHTNTPPVGCDVASSRAREICPADYEYQMEVEEDRV